MSDAERFVENVAAALYHRRRPRLHPGGWHHVGTRTRRRYLRLAREVLEAAGGLRGPNQIPGSGTP